jgi:hypothetical protein
MKVPLAGGTPTTLASGPWGFLGGIAVADSSVYWTRLSPGAIMKLTPTCACARP